MRIAELGEKSGHENNQLINQTNKILIRNEHIALMSIIVHIGIRKKK